MKELLRLPKGRWRYRKKERKWIWPKEGEKEPIKNHEKKVRTERKNVNI